MTQHRCSAHTWVRITWLDDDGKTHSHEMICRHCAESVTVTAAGDVTSRQRMATSSWAG